ncbi:MAG: hypothetical protein ACOX1P_26280 [Thermoguttaceae bacterium]
MRLSKPFAQSARWRFVLLGVIVTFCAAAIVGCGGSDTQPAAPTGSPDAAGQAERPGRSGARIAADSAGGGKAGGSAGGDNAAGSASGGQAGGSAGGDRAGQAEASAARKRAGAGCGIHTGGGRAG